MNLLRPDVPSALKKDYLTIAFQVSETLIKCTKELHILNYCSHKINKYLIQNIDLYNIHKKSCYMYLLGQFFQYLFLAVRQQ